MSLNVASFQTTTETSDAEVNIAVHAFAQVLVESAEFQAYEQSAERLKQDEAAQQVTRAYQKKQQSLKMIQRLNAESPQDQAEMEHLQKTFLNQPSVAAFLQAQEDLNLLCQATAGLLSERIGLSFTAACGPGCC
jgi:cell fate (sporulation/competence/biofilm development) regulator YlbF (YheA/YmcA/DUF963 family)